MSKTDTKPCDSLRAVDGDDGSHQGALFNSRNELSENIPSQVDTDSSYSNKITSSESENIPSTEIIPSVGSIPNIESSEVKQQPSFDFNKFTKSPQFNLALEILNWFQNEKLARNSDLLNENQTADLNNVTKKYLHDKENVSAANTADVMDMDSKFYKLPAPKTRTPETPPRRKREIKSQSLSDKKADEILQKLISKIESRYKKNSSRKVYYQEESYTDTTSTTFSSAYDNPPKMLQLVRTRSQKRTSKPVSCYKLVSEEDKKSKKQHRVVEKQVEKVYIKDQAIQTDSVENAEKKRCSVNNAAIQRNEQDENKENETFELTKTISQMSLDKPDATEPKGDSTVKVDEVIQVKNLEEKEKTDFLYKNRHNLAWYEPISSKNSPQARKLESKKPASLQDLLMASKPGFVSRLHERQRLLSITAEERKLQAVWRSDREKLFGKSVRGRRNPKKSPFPTARTPFQKKRAPMTRSEMLKYSRDKYLSLPEVQQKKIERQRVQEYAANRENQKRFNRKVQNHVLRKVSQNY